MARIELLTDRDGDLDEAQRRVFDRVVASRGGMIRPFAVLLHSPEIGEAIAEVGAKLRYGSSLADHDRELLTLTVGATHGCRFVLDSHVEHARAAGVREEVLAWLDGGATVELSESEELVVGAVRELCASASVPAERFAALRARFGDAGAIEFTTTVGYYTMLAYVMGAADACD